MKHVPGAAVVTKIENTIPVILAGGSGTRLWPMSRGTMPKQFLRLGGQKSFLQQTVERSLACFAEKPWIITTDRLRFLVDEQLAEIGAEGIRLLLEPAGRDTAAAAFLVALAAVRHAPGRFVLLQPSDHLISDVAAFAEASSRAVARAAGGEIALIGLAPDRAETGYGYIEGGEEVAENVHRVASFKEKPTAELAETYSTDGRHLWNAGMFLFDPQVMLQEAEHYAPEILAATRAAYESLAEEGPLVETPSAADYARIPALSIDYAVMEHTKAACVVAGRFGWSDVGSWQSAWDALPKDEQGNVAGESTLLRQTRNSYVQSSGPMVVVNDVEDLVVVADSDAVFVGSRKSSQSIKEMLALLKASGHQALIDEHKTVHRPWGGYTSLVKMGRFQVKRLFVKPGKRLSLQRHYHRSEHWIVVSGCGEVTINETTKLLHENESVYIAAGDTHRLANPGKVLLEIIEVQTGTYLGEDDIIRFEDDFRRAPQGA